MGLRDFSALYGYKIELAKHTPYTEPPKRSSSTFYLPTAKEITLAEISPAAREAVTAHRLADYRRRTYSLVLLPNIRVALDDLWDLEGLEADVSL